MRRHGVAILTWSDRAIALRRRAALRYARSGGPDLSDAALIERIADGCRTAHWQAPPGLDRTGGLRNALDGLLGSRRDGRSTC